MAMGRRGGETAAVDMLMLLPTPFLTKTYQLVDDRATDDIISWNVDGSAFIVWDQTEFARDLLPKHFKHNNFSSFIRQLNTYGFRKSVPDRWEFSHDYFRRGERMLLCEIHRRKMPSTASPSYSGEGHASSSAINRPPGNGSRVTELIGENERLRRENLELKKELGRMKTLCNDIYALMSSYPGACKPPFTETAVPPAPHGGEEIGARLFGVPIGAKRQRGNEGTSAEAEMDSQLCIKYEPLDEGGDQD